MAQHFVVDYVRATAEEYGLAPDLDDPNHGVAMERWEQIDPRGERRAAVSGASVIPVVVLDE